MTARAAVNPGELSEVVWHISTKSANGGGNCVEAGPVLDGSGRVAVRHSRRPEGDVLVYAAADWAAFLTGVKAGGFAPR